MGAVERRVDLVVPIKRLDRAKSRLRGVVPADEHAGLVLALLLDTVAAAAAADVVRRVLVVGEDERIPAALHGLGLGAVECVDERGLPGLNAALSFGAERLRTPDGTVGALQADLPALRPADLTAAVEEAAGRRAYCADRPGTGTTLLLAAPGEPLDPRFGPGSARAHAATGAVRIGAARPAMRCDVDTGEDLGVAARLGLGPRTAPLAAARGEVHPPVRAGVHHPAIKAGQWHREHRDEP
jgi:2-phospho-L-lactate guanylyltransferase